MSTTKFCKLTYVLLACLAIASCNKHNQKWDAMEWKAETEATQTNKGTYEIPTEGATLIFSCSNYSQPWLVNAKENDQYLHLERVNDKAMSVDGEYFHAEIKDNNLTVAFKANDNSQTNEYTLTVTAGDIFYTFNFKQSASSVVENNCQITYTLRGISDDMLKYYDITVDYIGLDGKKHTKAIAGNEWKYAPDPVSVSGAPEEFECTIVAVRKDPIPQIVSEYDSYEIGYGVEASVTIYDQDGNVLARKKQPQMATFSYRTGQTGIEQFLDKMEKIEIATLATSKEDLIKQLN